MKTLLAITAILVAVAVVAPMSYSAEKPLGITIITDTLGGNRHHRDAAPGIRMITDTLGGNGGVRTTTVVRDAGFSWPDAGIGAAAIAGTLLLVAGTRRVVVRRRAGLAI